MAYTLNNLKTQIFPGTQLTDLAWYDFTQPLGVKHKIDGFGFVQVGFLHSGIAIEV
ncbi:MAG: hypothetical protein GY850_17445 [bacterium]|nr:hypothetical protein [bacterium]